MDTRKYRVESSHPMRGPLLPGSGSADFFMGDRGLAIAVAAKSVTCPLGQEIRVVHVPSGEVVYRKTSAETYDSAE
jgi:hypothetical protein